MAIFRLKRVLPFGIFLFVVFGAFSQRTYVPDKNFRTAIRKKVWPDLKVKTPKKQLFLTQLVFNSNQCFDLFEKAARQRNWPAYQGATVLAFREVVLKEAIRGKDYSESEIQEVYEFYRRKVNNKDPDVTMNNKELQEKYDPLILESLWIGTLSELIKGRNDDAKKLAQDLLRTPDKEVEVVKKKPSVAAEELPVKETDVTTVSSNNDKAVDDIILRTVTNYGLNGVYIDNEVSILFKNGDLITNPSKPLNELNSVVSKRNNPKKWATWKKKGNIIYVTKAWKNKTYDWKKWFKLRPAKKGGKIVGTYTTLDAFGGDRVINASTVSFDTEGRFAWKTIKGGNTPWKPVYSKSASAGTYQIDGYRITLNYNNGQRESFFFGFYPKDNEHFVIGVGHFVPK